MYPGICQLSRIFCLLTNLVYAYANFLAFYTPLPPLLNSYLLSVLLAYLNKMGTFHWFLLILSVSSIYCYNEEEEEAYLFVKPSISSFVNGSNIVQTPPTTRRPYNVPRMPDLTTTRTTIETSSTTSTTPSIPRTTTPRPTTTTSKPSFLPTVNRYKLTIYLTLWYRITVLYRTVPYSFSRKINTYF